MQMMLESMNTTLPTSSVSQVNPIYGESAPYRNCILHNDCMEIGALSGEENMSRDEELVRHYLNGELDPSTYSLRLYTWNPWTVSLGANQKITDIDLELCKKLGFEVVRRLTGGRAVLHANELTYSITCLLSQYDSIHTLYKRVHEAILQGLHKLGIAGIEQLSFEKSQPKFSELYKQEPVSTVACFASSARYEIMADGKKVVGSAQRVLRDGNSDNQPSMALLQHGSILIGSGHEQLSDVTADLDSAKRERLREFIQSKSATLQDVCGSEISITNVAKVLSESFKATML
jgi:lipoate-protein ligase A